MTQADLLPLQPLQASQLRWDIFCRVIDNYGDIGVSWRLAQRLHKDHHQQVRLWLDQPHALALLVPQYQADQPQDWCQGIEVRHWLEDFDKLNNITPADSVIETFGCELPSSYLAKMRALAVTQQPIWINLEYLTAEPWATEYHLRPSKQACGLDKSFFFPGMLPGTGGLMREHHYHQKRMTAIEAPAPLSMPKLAKDCFKISVFSYENNALNDLVTILSNPATPLPEGYQSVALLIPEGRTLGRLDPKIRQTLNQQACWQQHQLSIYPLPFMSQADYDQLLWRADLNLVRGEESFVRAQWAAKPFIWQIYPTQDHAHWDKLAAFNRAYTAGTSESLCNSITQWQLAWNQQQLNQQAWSSLVTHWAAWQQQANDWALALEKLGELTTNLVKFVKSKV